MRILVTGGAGFVGRHLVNALTEAGHAVVVLDNLDPGIYPSGAPDLDSRAEYIWEDIRDPHTVREAAQDVEAVCHLASLIEVAEGEREIGRYVDVNVRGTAVLLDELRKVPSLTRLILTSSVAVYGEGVFECSEDGKVIVSPRSSEQLKNGSWEVSCPHCRRPVQPKATPEETPPRPASVYGLTKLVQEKLFEAETRAGGIPSYVFRLGNVFGPGQREGAYAGVVQTFLRHLVKGEKPVVHEDGEQTRDFVYVGDVVQATLLALEAPGRGMWVGNIASGRATSVNELVKATARLAGFTSESSRRGTFREGDLRHLYLDIGRASRDLGFAPSMSLEVGLQRVFDELQEA